MKKLIKTNCNRILAAICMTAMSGVAFGQHWDLGGNSISDPDTEFIGTLSDFPFRIWTAGTERMVVDQNGLVGIGTMYPTVNLDIFGEEKQQLFIRSSSADALLRLHAVGNYVDIYNPISTSGDLRFGFNGTDRVTFTSTGNVGIGETNPNSKLYVLSADDIGTTNFVQFLAANKTQGLGFGYNRISAIGINTDVNLDLKSKGAGTINMEAEQVLVGPANGSGSWFPFFDGNVYITGDGVGSGRSGDIQLRSYLPGSPNIYQTHVKIRQDGKVGIGKWGTDIFDSDVNKGSHKLYVSGSILAESVRVRTAANWFDNVFKSDYKLTPLSELELFISENQHLPGVPSEVEVTKNGFDLEEMDGILLKKIEELTLYVIELNRQNNELKKRVQQLEK